MRVKQFVMAYEVEHDKIKKLLYDEFESLRPVLRINIEIRKENLGSEAEDEMVRIEFNTPVAARGKRGWLNLRTWESTGMSISYQNVDRYKREKNDGNDTVEKKDTIKFTAPFLAIEYTGVGIVGGCPAEDDNDGCFFWEEDSKKYIFAASEVIDGFKEYCDCEFQWTDPFMEEMKRPCLTILGAYKVEFERL